MGILNLPSQDSNQIQTRQKKMSLGECGRVTNVKTPPQDLVMGQVKILKRGEDCNLVVGQGTRKATKTKTKAKYGDLVVWSTNQLGHEPEMVQRQIRALDLGVYAGLAVFTSPPPSSLPVPWFLENGLGRFSKLQFR